MKTSIKLILVAIAIVVAGNTAKANNEKPNNKVALTATLIDGGKVLITPTNLFDATAQYEIEKSVDNKNFTTAFLIFADENGKTLSIKDQPKTGTKKMYYRIKKTTNNTTQYSETIQIALR
jgi:hypothetical protein